MLAIRNSRNDPICRVRKLPQVALFGHARPATLCPFLRVEPTSKMQSPTPVHDPERKSSERNLDRGVGENRHFQLRRKPSNQTLSCGRKSTTISLSISHLGDIG